MSQMLATVNQEIWAANNELIGDIKASLAVKRSLVNRYNALLSYVLHHNYEAGKVSVAFLIQEMVNKFAKEVVEMEHKLEAVEQESQALEHHLSVMFS